MAVEQPSSKKRAVTTNEQMPPLCIFQQSCDAGPVDGNIDGVEPAMHLVGQRAGVGFIANPQIAAQPETVREPRQKQYRNDRSGQLEQLRGHGALLMMRGP